MKKSYFWIIFVLLSIFGIAFTVKYYKTAFPIVALDLRMDRQQALQSARNLAEKYHWGTKDYRQAVSFNTDSDTQYFVEYEGGGAQAFIKMMVDGLYEPYTWQVRHFKENEKKETLIVFTSKGEPYGFVETLPEDEAGANLTENAARDIAEKNLAQQWHLDLSAYKEIEASAKLQPKGRKDHTFVYERLNSRLKEGRYRMQLVVSGDRFTGLMHFVKIPEAFSRRYEEMRSANNIISNGSNITQIIMLVIGIYGTFFLMPQWVLWRKAIIWGIFITFMGMFQYINQLPQAWMYYNTAISEQSFLIETIVFLLSNNIFNGLSLIFTFIIAESLTRKAFPNHIRMWNLWSADVANSPSVLGRTISGYLLVGLKLAFVTAFYLFASRVLNWHTSLETLYEPNILANYFPWLLPISNSLHAGFWEECMFRALPIAGAALIGQRFGRRRAWIVAAFILQALVFGAGHAFYAQQPAYARLVELFIPSLFYGLIYLYFGLLPVIIWHFVYDVVWFSIPVFVSKAPRVWIDQGIIVILALVPLLVVFVSRFRRGSWGELKEEHYNRSWQPSVEVESVKPVSISPVMMTISKKTGRIILICGIVGIGMWIYTAKFQNFAPSQTIGRDEAKVIASKTLIKQGIKLSDSWEVLCSVDTTPIQSDRFVWQTGSKKIYNDLLGTYLHPPLWNVRFVQFKGDIAERAEQYYVYISIDGKVLRVSHYLPEARADKSLTKDQAQAIANQVLIDNYNFVPDNLKKISATPYKLPNRTDWSFIFADTQNSYLKKDEARIAVMIAGDKLVDTNRYINVPQEWDRQEQNLFTKVSTIGMFCGVLLFIIIIFSGYVYKDVKFNKKTFLVSTFLKCFILLFTVNIILFINNWSSFMYEFVTTEPLKNQIFSIISTHLLISIVFAGSVALYIEFIQKHKVDQSPSQSYKTIPIGIAIGTFYIGYITLMNSFVPSLEPFWADYSNINNYITGINLIIIAIIKHVIISTYLLVVLMTISRLIRDGRNKIFSFGIIILTIMALNGLNVTSVNIWLLSSLVMGIVFWVMYHLVFRYHLSLLPISVGTFVIINNLKQGVMNAYPTAIYETVLMIIAISLLSFYWFRKLADKN